mmetsp:Transcript_11639/g.34503  ORF Transcript_11639/g.34503 Transcript_11639/m.34503 type:complete len:217 (-) Transcript_11639:919-1569(-)
MNAVLSATHVVAISAHSDRIGRQSGPSSRNHGSGRVARLPRSLGTLQGRRGRCAVLVCEAHTLREAQRLHPLPYAVHRAIPLEHAREAVAEAADSGEVDAVPVARGEAKALRLDHLRHLREGHAALVPAVRDQAEVARHHVEPRGVEARAVEALELVHERLAVVEAEHVTNHSHLGCAALQVVLHEHLAHRGRRARGYRQSESCKVGEGARRPSAE